MLYCLRAFLFSFLVLVAVNSVSFADTVEERTKAATAYEKLVPVKDIVDGYFDGFKENPKIHAPDEDIEKMRAIYDYETTRLTQIQMLVKHFTLEELEAMIAFYSAPAGQSAMKKMPLFVNEFMPSIHSTVMAAVQKISLEKKIEQDKKAEEQQGE